MADDERVSKESRQTFLSSFEGDINQFLEASESEDNHPLTDVEITTDLGGVCCINNLNCYTIVTIVLNMILNSNVF